MSSKEFWDDDPAILWSYYVADKRKMETEHTFLDITAWLHGAYVYEAVSCVMSNAFSSKRGKSFEYPNQPRSLSKSAYANLTDEEILKKEQQEMMARIKHQHNKLTNVPKFQTK